MATELIKPGRLRAGDRVAVMSTSFGAAALFPHVFDRGLAHLRETFGLEIVEYPTARMSPDELWRHPERRAEDLNRAFADPDVRAIITSIGGDDSVRILPYLDAEVARLHPKIILGYSDTSTQLIFYHLAGLVTFNGPSVMAGFAQLRHFPDTAQHIRDLLFEPTEQYDYRPSTRWVDGYVDWTSTTDGDELSDFRAHDGWHWLQGAAPVEGRLFGGCFETLESLKGTRFWPSPDFWAGRVVFLDGSEDTPSIEQVTYWLRNYAAQGVFDDASALLIGRARDYTTEQKHELDRAVLKVVADECGADLPVVTNLDFGHTDPQWILPLGCRLQVDPGLRTLRLLEPAVS